MNTFRRSLPLISTSFINKTGTIGLSLVPMILVEHQLSAGHSSLMMTFVKASTLGGTLLGGLCCDRLGMKRTLLLSFLLAALGMGAIPAFRSLNLIILGACICALGQAMYPGVSRLLVSSNNARHHQQEAIGWLRTANNAGMIASFSLGWLLSSLGISALMIVDAVTSLLAVLFSARMIPTDAALEATERKGQPRPGQGDADLGSWRLFIMNATAIAAYTFVVEMVFTGTAARCRLLFGEEGLAVFSKMMLINVTLCATLAIPAAKTIKNTSLSFPLGLGLVGLGLTLLFGLPPSAVGIYAGAFCYSLGEVIFMSLATYSLIQVTPATRRRGTVYSSAIFLQQVTKIAGAALVFPLMVHGKNTLPVCIAVAVALLAYGSWVGLQLTKHFKKAGM